MILSGACPMKTAYAQQLTGVSKSALGVALSIFASFGLRQKRRFPHRAIWHCVNRQRRLSSLDPPLVQHCLKNKTGSMRLIVLDNHPDNMRFPGVFTVGLGYAMLPYSHRSAIFTWWGSPLRILA